MRLFFFWIRVYLEAEGVFLFHVVLVLDVGLVVLELSALVLELHGVLGEPLQELVVVVLDDVDVMAHFVRNRFDHFGDLVVHFFGLSL